MKNIDIDSIKDFLENEAVRANIARGGAVIAVLLYAMLVVVPGMGKFFKKKSEVEVLERQIDSVTDRVNRIDSMTEKLNSLKTELEGYSGGLPDQKEIPELLEGLASIAKVSGVKILSITPSDLKDSSDSGAKGYYKEMPITITAESGYHQLGRFISNLEEGSRFIAIEDLRIQHNEDFPRRHDVSMTLKTYVSG